MKADSSRSERGATVPVTEATAEASGSLVTKKVVARANSVSTRTVDYWKKRRLIPFVKISARCVRFHLPSVLAALRKMEVKEATRQ
jgi:hypothetical protein